MTTYETLTHPEKFKRLVFKAAGVSFNAQSGRGRQEIIKTLKKDTFVCVERDENNKYDQFAVCIYAVLENGSLEDIGFIPRGINETVFMLLKSGVKMDTKIIEITEPRGQKDFYGVKLSVDIKGKDKEK